MSAAYICPQEYLSVDGNSIKMAEIRPGIASKGVKSFKI